MKRTIISLGIITKNIFVLRIHIMLKSAFLGYAKVAQVTIDAPVNQKKIEIKLLKT